MSKWEPSNAEMRQFFNDIHSISSSLKRLAATAEESTHTIKEFYELVERENEKFEREVAEDEKKRQEEAAKAFDEGLQDGLRNDRQRYLSDDDDDYDMVADMLDIPIEPDPDERG